MFALALALQRFQTLLKELVVQKWGPKMLGLQPHSGSLDLQHKQDVGTSSQMSCRIS